MNDLNLKDILCSGIEMVTDEKTEREIIMTEIEEVKQELKKLNERRSTLEYKLTLIDSREKTIEKADAKEVLKKKQKMNDAIKRSGVLRNLV